MDEEEVRSTVESRLKKKKYVRVESIGDTQTGKEKLKNKARFAQLLLQM